MSTQAPSVTIAIPTFNGLDWLRSSIDTFIGQEYTGDLRILVMDSGSTDGTIEFLEEQGIEVERLPSHPFNHGRTRNNLVNLVASELVLFTVQDARPRSRRWVQDMVDALLISGSDAVCGGQCVPQGPETNPMQWFRPIHNSRAITTYTGHDYDKSDNEDRCMMCRWDNVNALYKTNVLKEIPFPQTEFGEDLAWARAALNSGKRIGYCDGSKVDHYHHENPTFVRTRTICTAFSRWSNFNVIPQEGPSINLLWWGRLIHTLTLRRRIISPLRLAHWIQHNWENQRARNAAILEVRKAIDDGTIVALHASLNDPKAAAPNPSH